jgi:hypothetical protein
LDELPLLAGELIELIFGTFIYQTLS